MTWRTVLQEIERHAAPGSLLVALLVCVAAWLHVVHDYCCGGRVRAPIRWYTRAASSVEPIEEGVWDLDELSREYPLEARNLTGTSPRTDGTIEVT